MKAKVYFSKQITPEKVVELYKAVGLELPGKVAVKVHSGEPGNQNFLTPEFWQPMVETVHRLSRRAQHDRRPPPHDDQTRLEQALRCRHS